MQRIELFLTRVQNSLILIRERFQGILARVWMVRVGQEVEKYGIGESLLSLF
jgi:hypothetical protein